MSTTDDERPTPERLADRVRAEANHWAWWALTSWPGAESMLKQAEMIRGWAAAIDTLTAESADRLVQIKVGVEEFAELRVERDRLVGQVAKLRELLELGASDYNNRFPSAEDRASA